MKSNIIFFISNHDGNSFNDEFVENGISRGLLPNRLLVNSFADRRESKSIIAARIGYLPREAVDLLAYNLCTVISDDCCSLASSGKDLCLNAPGQTDDEDSSSDEDADYRFEAEGSSDSDSNSDSDSYCSENEGEKIVDADDIQVLPLLSSIVAFAPPAASISPSSLSLSSIPSPQPNNASKFILSVSRL